MSGKSLLLVSGRAGSRAAALAAVASFGASALADDIFWAGNQGCGGAVERGSWFDSANWFGFSPPGAGDRVILEEPPGSVRPPYIIHFGNFGKCPDGCGEEMIEGGAAVIQSLEVSHRGWLFDFASGMEGTCGAAPAPLTGSLHVVDEVTIGRDTRSAKLSVARGLISTEHFNVGISHPPTVGELNLLDVDAGLIVRTLGDINLGFGSGNHGILRVADGAAAEFHGQLIVGREGADATVHITGGSHVMLGQTLVGSGVGSGGGGHASVFIGDGATLHCERAAIFGDSGGTAEVTVEQSAMLMDGPDAWCAIGRGAGAAGTLTVRGALATCEVRRDIVVGLDLGKGILLIDGGATVSADAFAVGQGEGTGEVTVRGAGSSLRGLWGVGSGGFGRLRVEGGAKVSSLRADGSSAFAFVGEYSGRVGVVEINGPGSIWKDVARLSLGGVWHSDTAGDGTVIIAAGGRIECTEAFIASYWPANRGRIEVNGSGSTLAVSGGIALGNPGNGALVLANGGEASCSAATFGPGATLHVEIGAAGAGALTASGPVTVSGALEVALAPGFEPSVGQEFTIITAGSLDGDFATIDAPGFRVRTSAGALSITYCPCRADMDCDGDLSFFDFLAFQDLFAAADPLADLDGDGDLTFFDFLAFQNEFASGCA